MVNGQKVQQAVLREGSRIEIGSTNARSHSRRTMRRRVGNRPHDHQGGLSGPTGNCSSSLQSRSSRSDCWQDGSGRWSAGTQELETPPPPSRRGSDSVASPRVFVISQGNQAGLSAELAGGVIMIGRGADCQLILDDDYVSTGTPRGQWPERHLRRGSRLHERHLRKRSADHRADHDHARTRYASAKPC